MGIYLKYEPDGTISIQPDKFKADEKLVRYISGLIQADIKYQEARNKPVKPDKLEKSATVTRPDGTVSALSKAQAVQVLQDSVDTWQDRAMSPGLDKDLKSWLLQRADLAKDEIRRLNGEDVPEREPVAKSARPVTVTLPR